MTECSGDGGARLRVQLVDRDAEPRELELVDFPADIGRRDDCAVAVADPKVSRQQGVIEARDDGVYLADRNSVNGFKRNGGLVQERRLRRGDELRFGDCVLRILAVECGGDREAPPAGELTRVHARRRRSLLAPPVLLIVVLAAIVVWVKRDDELAPAIEPDPRIAEARAEIAQFSAEVAEAASIDASMVRRTRELAARYEGVDFGRARPLRELVDRVERRRSLELHQSYHRVRLRFDALLEAHRYAEIAPYGRQVYAQFAAEPRDVREYIDLLVAGRLRRVDAAFRRARRELEWLESADFRAEAEALYDRSLEDFAGTDYAPPLTAARVRWHEEVQAFDAQRSARRAALAAAVPVATGDEAGELTRLLRAHDAGEHVTAGFRTLSRSEQLQVAIDALGRAALLEVARVAYRWQLPAMGDWALVRALADDATLESGVNAVLAESLGLDDIPEGGYHYQEGVGWLDAAELRERAALAQAQIAAAQLTPDAEPAKLRSVVAYLGAEQGSEALSPATRQAIRDAALGGLASLQEQLIASLPERAANSLAKLRALKEELNARRAAALAIIYDATTYLPEDHPDWPKGDRVNGQYEVDAAVRAVCELWEETGDASIALGKVAARVGERLHIIVGELYPLLHHDAELTEDSLLADLVHNPGPVIQLRTFALDRAEARLRAFNDKVEEYHRGFRENDLTPKDLAHIVFVNDYREMMGRQRTFVDIRLCRATRKHSAVCNEYGTIWHVGRDGSPQSRAEDEGFTAGVGENVAIGHANPQDIWTRGWYRASDHHRNALAAGWNCMGYGYVGRVGTENFATIEPPFALPEMP